MPYNRITAVFTNYTNTIKSRSRISRIKITVKLTNHSVLCYIKNSLKVFKNFTSLLHSIFLPYTCMYAKHPLPYILSLNFIIILIVFSYTFFVVTFAAVAIFSYAFLVPTALWGVFLWRKSNAGYSFLEILCVYGYSLFIYIPISVSFTAFLP